MRARPALVLMAGFLGVAGVGCSTDVGNLPDGGSAAITLLPAGPILTTAGGPSTSFTALTSTGGTVAWTLSPAVGTISPTSGLSNTYTPPATATAAAQVTLTATLSGGGGSASVAITVAANSITIPAGKIPGLTATVTVTFDERDIPNIACTKQEDCFAVQGYIHARDRLFEMDVFRRTALGEMAELVGDNALASDKQFRTLFMTRDGQRLANALVATLDADTRSKVEAYARGVTTYITQMKAGDPAAPMPAEYGMLLYPVPASAIRDWTVADTLAEARLFQFQLSETLSKEIDVGQFYLTYGPGAPLEDLGKVNAWIRCQQPIPAFTLSANAVAPGGGTTAAAARAPVPAMPHLKDAAQTLRELSARLHQIPGPFVPVGDRAGSNNWVIKGTSSATGKSMVANDPHLSLNYPPLFHLATLTGDGLQVLGGAFPGVPGALIGRGAHVAWGVTVVGYDVTDVYVEQVAGATPQGVPQITFLPAAGGKVTLIPVQQTVGIRTSAGIQTQTITVLVSPPHGPIIGQISATQLLSMRWTGLELTNDVKAFLGLLQAPDVNGAFVALKDYSTGAQNFVLADDQGNIGYDPHALVPQRPWAGGTVNLGTGDIHLFPWAPLPGVGVAEWGIPGGALWIPDDQLPQGKNPAKGYFATANSAPSDIYCVNNNPLPAGVPYLSFDWDDPTGFRAGEIMKRLGALTADGGTVALSDMEAIQTDHIATMAAAFMPAIQRQAPAGNASYDSAKALMTAWNTSGLDCPTGLVGTDPTAAVNDPDPGVTRDSSACLLFHAFLNRLLVNVFAADLALAGQGIESGNSIRGMLYMLTPGLPAAAQTFCVPLGAAPAATSCDAQVVTAMTGAYDALTQAFGAQSAGNWRWGRLHTMSPKSLVFPLVAGFFNPGPYARPGGAFTVDVGTPSLHTNDALIFQYGSGSNVRYIAITDGSATKMQLPGPIVDGPLYPGSPGLLGQYVVNQYFDFPYGSSQIAAATVRTQTFSAP
jgi:penicillin amidase